MLQMLGSIVDGAGYDDFPARGGIDRRTAQIVADLSEFEIDFTGFPRGLGHFAVVTLRHERVRISKNASRSHSIASPAIGVPGKCRGPSGPPYPEVAARSGVSIDPGASRFQGANRASTSAGSTAATSA